MRGKPGYEHLNEPLHVLVEAELPIEIIDARLMQARDILEDLLKPLVIFCTLQIPFIQTPLQWANGHFGSLWVRNTIRVTIVFCKYYLLKIPPTPSLPAPIFIIFAFSRTSEL